MIHANGARYAMLPPIEIYLLATALIEGADGSVQLLDGDRHGRTPYYVDLSNCPWGNRVGRTMQRK